MRRPGSVPKPPKKPAAEAPTPVLVKKTAPTKPSKAPKPTKAPVEGTQKMVVYVSPETRQRVEAAVVARSAAFKLEFTTLTSIVVASFDWFFENNASLQEAVLKLSRHQAGEPPYSKSISLEAPVALARKYGEIPRGQRARIADAVIATWMSQHLSTV